jgi:replicative DNA helicase
LSVAESLLSKVVDANDAQAFVRFGIDRDHFATEDLRKAYDFIRTYADDNRGACPSYAIFAGANPHVTYIPAVSDSYEYLAKKLKDDAGKRMVAHLYEREIPDMFEKAADTGAFVDEMTARLERIKEKSRIEIPVGLTLEQIASEFRTEYERRKAGKSFKLWRTPFPSLNGVIGGLYSGDVYGVMAESGRGKTYLTEVLVDEMLRQGANVLAKSYEVKAYPWISRLISIITAREGAISDEQIGKDLGLPNKALLSGALEGEFEEYLFQTLEALGRYYPGKLYLQAKSDPGLTRNLDALSRELSSSKIDAVVIDAFYNLDDVYGTNVNRTAGGAAEQAARKFEKIVGDNDVVGIYTVQAHSERQEGEDGGHRDVKTAGRDRMKTTKALIDISTNIFSFDSTDGNGRITLLKGRNGGEDYSLDLIALLDYGVLRELPSSSEAAAQFRNDLPF